MSDADNQPSAPANTDAKTDASAKDLSGDDLLLCLEFLTAHYGRAKSAQAITAGLAYDENNMRPALFREAANRLALKTKTVKKDKLDKIPQSVLPVVLILHNDKACVLLSRNQADGTAQIFSPDVGEVIAIAEADLTRNYSGYAIYTRPKPEFTNPDSAYLKDTDHHWFWGIVEEHKSLYALVLLGAVFINLFGLVSPLFMMNVYDRVIPNSAIETGWAFGIGALTIFIFDFIMRNLRSYLIDFSGRKIDVIAAQRIYDQVLNMQLSERPKSSGSFANMLHDFNAVREFFTSATITALVDLPFTLLFLFIIYQLGGMIAFVLLGLVVCVVAIGLLLQAPLKSLVRKATQSAEAKHGLLVETIHGLETIKAIGADGKFRSRYSSYVGENAALGQQSRFISGLGVNSASFIQQIAAVIVILFGMYLVRDGDLSVGALIACVILGGKAIAPIGQIAGLMTKYHQATSALKTLENIMGKTVERPAHKQFLNRPDISGKITFDKVSFAYPAVDREVLTNLNFTIEAGEKVGIIGRIGSGKSTISRLMMGLYQPASGSILADDTDYRQIDPADLRRNFAYIAQDVVLFAGSVRDNICASMPHASDEQILTAAKRAGVHDFVSKHPMGYDAPVGEHGSHLSGGQRQTVALARAMLIDPNVLVCDEPTNAMDMQAEAVFKTFIREQTKDKTLILVTHKNTMLDMVDRLILMEQGRILMDGPRDKVLEALKTGNLGVKTENV